MPTTEHGVTTPLLNTLALLRGATIVGLHADGRDINVRLALPALAQRLASATRHLELVLTDCDELWLQPFEAPNRRIDRLGDLLALGPQLLNLLLPDGAEPGIQVLATASQPQVHGGLLRARAAGYVLRGETGVVIAEEQLARAATELVAERLRKLSLSDLRKNFDSLMKQDITPVLVAHGFAPRRLTFTRADAEVAQVLRVEIGRFSTALSLSFTVQLELYLGSFHAGEALRLAELQQQAAPVWSVNAGELWGDTNATYTLVAAGELQTLERDLAGQVLPALQRLRTATDVIAFLDERDRAAADPGSAFALASALARAGRVDESRPFFARALGADETANEALRRYANSLGVVL